VATRSNRDKSEKQNSVYPPGDFPQDFLAEYIELTRPIVDLIGEEGLDRIAAACLQLVKGDWPAFMAWIKRCPELVESVFNIGGTPLVSKAFAHVELIAASHPSPAARFLVKAPQLFEIISGPESDDLVLFISNTAKFSWEAASRIVEKCPFVIERILAISSRQVLNQVLKLTAQVAQKNWDSAISIFQQSPENIDALLPLVTEPQLIELLAAATKTSIQSSVASKKLLNISPEILREIDFAGLLSVAQWINSMSRMHSETAGKILDASPEMIPLALRHIGPDQVLGLFELTNRVFSIHHKVGLAFFHACPVLLETVGFHNIAQIVGLCEIIGKNGWQTAVGIIEVAPKLVKTVGFPGLERVAELSLRISQVSSRTAAGFSRQAAEMLEKLDFKGLEEYASFCINLAQDGSSIAVAFLEKNPDLVNELLLIGTAGQVADVYRLANVSAVKNPIIALKVLEKSPDIIGRIGLKGLKDVADLSIEIAKESWTTADSLVKVLPDLIDRIGFANVPKIADICLAIAKDNVYGTINLIEKSPAIIDELLAYGDKELIIDIWELVKQMSLVTWRAGVVFFEQSPRLIEQLGPTGTVNLAKLSGKIAERNSGLAIGLIETGPELVKQLGAEGLDKVCEYCLLTSNLNPESSISFLKNSPYLFERLLAHGDRTLVVKALSMAIRVADISWKVSYELLKKSPDYVDMTGFEGLEMIAERAIFLAKTDKQHALRFVKGESADFTELMDDLPKGLELNAIKSVLSKYLTALLSYPIEIEEGKSISTDGERIYLPKKTREFSNDEDNFTFYKVSATHLEGHLEFGSYEFDIESISETVNVLRSRYHAHAENTVGDLEAYYQLFPEPELAMDLISLLEDFRIESILRSEYPILGEQMQRMNEHQLNKRPSIQEMENEKRLLIELIYRELMTGQQHPINSENVFRCHAFATSIAQSLKGKSKDVHDSVVAATDLYLYIDGIIKDSYLPSHPITKPIEQSKVNENIGSFGKVSRNISEKMQTGGTRPGSEPASSEESSSESAGDAQPAAKQPLQDRIPMANQRPAEAGRTFDESDSGGKFGAEDSRSPDAESEAANSAMNFSSVSRIEKLLKALFKEKGITPKEVEKKTKSMRPSQVEMYLQNLESLVQTQSELEKEKGTYLYPEWNDDTGGYSANWARIREHQVPESSLDFYRQTLQKHSGLLKKIRREFQLLRPEETAKLRKQYDGDEIDLDAAVNYLIDRKIGLSPSEKNYMRAHKIKRDIAVAILIDMSRSTKGRTIQCEKEALVIMTEALREVGDAFAIYGFSGDNRDNVDFFRIKDFEQPHNPAVESRISAIDCRFENRDGTAIRHSLSLLNGREERTKLIILLSDGKPVDKEYSGNYAIEDTRMALLEAQKMGVETFCITVDKNASEYLPRMYSHSSWVVIDDINKLPEKMSRIYGRLTR